MMYSSMNPSDDAPIDTNAMEKKWQEKWVEAKVYDPNPEKGREKKYITAAFPYPNSPQHIGHARTYTTTDIYARYWRLRGYNVLFPMAFHVTGTPILAMAKRIEAKDEEVLTVFENIYDISRKTAATLTEPTALVTHFSKEIEAGMKEMGYAIDWRRKFYSFDLKFNKFIEWQFKKLKDQGLIVQGEHAVPWCPKDNNAVGGHDTKGDVDPELEEVTGIKFAYGDGYFVTTTYRPETVYGVTNIWLNPKTKIVAIKYKGETIYIAKAAAENLKLQLGNEIVSEHNASEFIGKNVKNPATGKEVPVFEASFVDEAEGTGVVMSVPAHAPYDYLALRDIGKANIEMPQVIKLEGFGTVPAKHVVEKMGVKDQNDPKAEEATKEIYTKEAHEGIMLADKYKGMGVIEAKEKVKADLIAGKKAFAIHTLANSPVYCRCGARICANLVRNQWFINYGDKKWKEKARECIAAMNVVPEKNRADYLYTIGWLKEKACTRAAGLGTRFPFDKTQTIEALSDSTIYMAFYTIAHLVSDKDADLLDEEFFDQVFYGKPTTSQLANKCRESFLYWYPVDSRHSGADLVRNHLPFFILNHVALFPKEQWPKQIAVNGFVLMDGKKMSKSMGNILPLRKAIKEYGADIIRFSVVSGADITQDTDFNKTVAEGTKTRIEQIAKMIKLANKGKGKKKIDAWLYSKLNRRIKKAAELYEKLAFRELSLEIFYGIYDDLKWYGKRNQGDYTALHDYFKIWSALIAPFMPHYAEEFWHTLGGKGLLAQDGRMPAADEKTISDEAERGEQLVAAVRDDVENLQNILKTKPKKVLVFVANDTKRAIYDLIGREKKFDLVMKAASADATLKTKMDLVQKMAKQLMKNAYGMNVALPTKEEYEAVKEAEAFLAGEFDCPVEVSLEEGATHPRAANAMPGKPSIAFE
jgi:leucyl-tRNA synthetase